MLSAKLESQPFVDRSQTYFQHTFLLSTNNKWSKKSSRACLSFSPDFHSYLDGKKIDIFSPLRTTTCNGMSIMEVAVMMSGQTADTRTDTRTDKQPHVRELVWNERGVITTTPTYL